MKKFLVKFFIISIAIVFVFNSAHLLSQDDPITSVSSKLVDQSGKKFVEVSYQLNKNTFVEILRVELKDTDNKSYEIKPEKAELSGDIWWVKAEPPGQRKFLWEWEKTLERNGMYGEYSCKVVIQNRGSKPSMIKMKIKNFKNGQFRVPSTTIDVSNFEEGTEIYTGVTGMGYYGTWYKTAEDDEATFFSAKQVNNFPYYNHNSTNFAGYPNLASGSSFFAYKDVTESERRIWINIAKGKNQGVGGTKYSDFQIIYYQRTDLIEYCKIGQCYAGADWALDDYPELEHVQIYYQDAKPTKSTEVILKPSGLIIEVKPKTSFKYRLKDTLNLEITVKVSDKTLVEGAEIGAINSITGTADPIIIGTTGANGMVKYKYGIAHTVEPGDYFIKVAAKKDNKKSDTTIITVKISNLPLLLINVSPGTIFNIQPEQEQNLKFTVSEGIGKPIINASIEVHDFIKEPMEKTIVGPTSDLGIYNYNYKVPKDTKDSDYAVKLVATKEGYDASDTTFLTITVGASKKIWTYYKDGAPYQKYKIVESNGSWEGAGPNVIKYENGNVIVNDYLKFSGGTIEIDTTPGNVNVKTDGKWYLENILLPGSTEKGELLIWALPFNADLMEGYINLKSIQQSALLGAKTLKALGFAVVLEKLEFVGGLKSVGIKFSGSLLIDGWGASGRCTEAKLPTWAKDRIGKFSVKDILIDNEGFHWPTSFDIKNVGYKDYFCIKSLSAKYDREADKLDFDGDINTRWFEGEFGVGLLNGGLDRLKLAIFLETPVPLPPIPMTPPLPIFAWKGCSFEVTGISGGNMSITGMGRFVNNTMESMLKVMPKLDAFKEFENLFEIDMTLRFPDPNTIEAEAFTKVFKVPFTDTWTMDGKETTTLKMWQSFGHKGEYRIGNFGGTKSIYEVTGGWSLSWYPSFIFSGSFGGSMYIPDLFPDSYWFGLLSNTIGLPWQIGSVELSMRNAQFATNVSHFFVGKWGVLLDLGKSPKDTNFLRVCKGGVNIMNKTLRINDTPLLLINPYQQDHQNVALITNEKKINNLPLANDTTFVEISTNTTMERLFVKVKGINAPAKSILINPAGQTITETKSDSSIMYIPGLRDKNLAHWIVVNPIAGLWKLGVINPVSTDSIFVFSSLVQRTNFSFSTSQTGREVTVNWNNTDYGDSAIVEVYIDDDDAGFDGKIMSSVPEKDGSVKILLNDTLTDCSFYVYAYRWDNEIGTKSYSKTIHRNDKTRLPAPTNIKAISNIMGKTNISWNIPNDSNITSYIVKAVDPSGIDTSVYTIAFNVQDSIEFVIPNHTNKKIYITSMDHNGFTGCPSEAVGIITGLQEEEKNALISCDITINLIPNPTSGISTVRISLPEPAFIRLGIFDILGNRVADIDNNFYEAGVFKTEINCADLQSGIFYIRLQTLGSTVTKMLVISK
jgi:hypothetical protein